MTQEDKINQLESKLSNLEMKVEFINKQFGLLPDQDEFYRAIEALNAGDPEPLDTYMKRGGKIPECVKSEASHVKREKYTKYASRDTRDDLGASI